MEKKKPTKEELKRVMGYLGTLTPPETRSKASKKAAKAMDPATKTARAKKAAAASAKVRTEKANRRKLDPAAP